MAATREVYIQSLTVWTIAMAWSLMLAPIPKNDLYSN